MASRINTKFVVLLIVAFVVMLAMVGVAYSVVVKSGDELVAAGDQLMAEGEYEQAKAKYGKAVGKDRSRADWMGKWIEAMEHMTPETETAYSDAFQTDYLAGLTAMSTIYRTDIPAHAKILDVYYQMLRTSYSRGSADRLIEATTRALTYFDGHPAGETQWYTLRRYRGLAYDRIVMSNGVIDDDQFALYREDLQAALQANPTDSESMAALNRWTLANAMREQIEGDDEPMTKATNEAIAACEAYLREHGDDPTIATMLLNLEIDVVRRSAGKGLEGTERTIAIVDAFKELSDETESLFALLMRADPKSISTDLIEQTLRIENATNPNSKFAKTRALMNHLVASDPTNPTLLWTSGRIEERAGFHDAAIERFESIVALPPRPLSYEGLLLYTRKRQSLVSIATIKIDQYQLANIESENDTPVKPELFAEAEELIAKFAQQVSEDDNQLLMLRGRVLEAKGDLNAALSLYKKYNEQTDRQFSDGLWREGIVARQLGQLGTARTALKQVINKKRFDVRAMLTLAEIETRLNNHRAAAEQYREVLVYNPTNEIALKGLENIRAIEDPASLVESNPVMALILTARQIRLGTDGQPGDLASAIELLSRGITDPAIDYAPSVARELAMLLMDNGDLVGARATIVQSAARNPDDESISRIAQAMQADDPVDILVTLINLTDRPEIDKKISIANVYIQRDRTEDLDALLADLVQTAGDDRRVLELSFTHAIRKDDIATAQALADQAAEQNTDSVRGLTYKARIESYKGDHEQAVRTLAQASALGTADASVFRMLAMEQRMIGQVDLAAESFQRALDIRPDDVSTIYEYIATLTRAGRFEQALDVARARQNFGSSDARFNNLWLMLEANYGGDEGREFAIRQRERMLEMNATDKSNTLELARMYVASKRWDDAKTLIDSLRASGDRLAYVELEATWNADQGRIGRDSGLALARDVYIDYISSLGDEVTDAPFISLARFMLGRGRPDLATQAASEAVRLEDPETMEGSKLFGDLQMTINQFAAAAEAYERVVAKNADPDNSYRAKLIESYLRLRKHDEALAQLDSLPEKDQGAKIAMLQRAEILSGLNRIDDARSVLNDAVAKYSDDPIVFIKRAESMIGEPELMTDLLSDVDQALKINGNDWRAYRVRAAAFFAADRRSDAMRDLQNAVRINPNLDNALFGVLNELVNDNRPGEALDLAKEILERRSSDAPLMAQIGHIFAARKDWNRAAEIYGMAWEKRRSPSDGAVYIDALVRKSPPDTDTANAVINDLGELAGGVDKSAGLLAAQALVLDARGRSDFAIQQLTKAFDLSVDDDTKLIGWYSNVSRFFDEKTAEEEIAYLDSIRRRKDIKQVQAWIDLFTAQRLSRDKFDTDRARALLETLITNSENPQLQRFAFQTYGSMLFSIEDYTGAQNIWMRGTELFADDWEMNNNIAYVLSEKLGKSEEALKYIEAVVDTDITRSEPYETAARIYTRLGQYDKATEMIKTGTRYALSVDARVTMIIADARLKLALGDTESARSQVLNAKSVLRSLPGINEDIEQTIKDVEEEIASAG